MRKKQKYVMHKIKSYVIILFVNFLNITITTYTNSLMTERPAWIMYYMIYILL